MAATTAMARLLRSSYLIPLGMIALLAAAFLTGRRPATDPAGRPIVVYAHPPCPPELMELYRPIWDEFRRTHPDIDFRVLHVTGNYEDKIKVMFAGKVAPDVIFMYPTALPAWVDLQALEPLDDLLAASGEVNRDDYFRPMLDAFTYGGRLYGLPKDASAAVMQYNVELFERHGVAKPQADWSWDDMLHAAKALTRDTDGDGRVDQWGLNPFPWYVFVWGNGGRIVDESGTRCTLLEPAALEAIEFWVALRVEHGVTPTVETASDLGAARLFALQRAAMHFEMYPIVSVFRKQCEFTWDLAPVPSGPRGRVTEVVGSAMAVTSQSRSKAAAFEFVRWMTSPAGMRFLVSVESPSCIALAKSDEFTASPGLPATKRVAFDVMDYARPPLQHPRYQEIMDVLDAELMKAQLGLVAARAALEAAVPRVDRILERRSAQ
jgi:multiple sugar transport system substrate-binding protein